MTMALPSDASAATETRESTVVDRLPGIAVAGISSLAAGAIHAGAIGIHAEHATLARLFVACAVFQLGWGLAALVRPSRLLAVVGVLGNTAAVAGWIATRVTGISWIGGLEVREAPQFTDTAAAVLGLVAAGSALAAALIGTRALPSARLALPAFAAAALTIPAMVAGSSHVHSEAEHAHATTDAAGATGATGATTAHDNSDGHHDDTSGGVVAPTGTTDESAPHSHDPAADASTWPRPYDPAQPIDLSGVDGVTAEQEARASTLLATTQEVLPRFADPATASELGFLSIGDSGTGFEHYVNYGYIGDDHFMDPEYPESLVYKVDGEQRTLASAMFIAQQMPVDAPELLDYAGPLMQWHIHDNLCWGLDESGQPKVVSVVGADGTCPPGSINTGGGNPMVHVWVMAHECGPFAALEGHGAGQVDPTTGTRADQCSHDHGATTAATDPKPYDPTQPIDLSGMPGVTPQQQAAAENLIAVTLYRLPQFADPGDAETAGFRSIHDGSTGYEHYMNWEWVNDGKTLDPDYPESLVYTPNPDGTKTLVSAMYMLPDGETLDDVPELGGPLTQWHIHNNLCFSGDPETTEQIYVVGLTNAEGECSFGVKLQENPMLHVWITPHPCGPFAALEGVGAGQIKEGETRLCDVAHGSH